MDRVFLNWAKIGELAAEGETGISFALTLIALWDATEDQFKHVLTDNRRLRPYFCQSKTAAKRSLGPVPLRLLTEVLDNLGFLVRHSSGFGLGFPLQIYQWQARGKLESLYGEKTTRREDIGKAVEGQEVMIYGRSYTVIHNTFGEDVRSDGSHSFIYLSPSKLVMK